MHRPCVGWHQKIDDGRDHEGHQRCLYETVAQGLYPGIAMHPHDGYEHRHHHDEHAGLRARAQDHQETREVQQPHHTDKDQRQWRRPLDQRRHQPRDHNHRQWSRYRAGQVEGLALSGDQTHRQGGDDRWHVGVNNRNRGKRHGANKPQSDTEVGVFMRIGARSDVHGRVSVGS
jgi:hypothetical protein